MTDLKVPVQPGGHGDNWYTMPSAYRRYVHFGVSSALDVDNFPDDSYEKSDIRTLGSFLMSFLYNPCRDDAKAVFAIICFCMLAGSVFIGTIICIFCGPWAYLGLKLLVILDVVILSWSIILWPSYRVFRYKQKFHNHRVIDKICREQARLMKIVLSLRTVTDEDVKNEVLGMYHQQACALNELIDHLDQQLMKQRHGLVHDVSVKNKVGDEMKLARLKSSMNE